MSCTFIKHQVMELSNKAVVVIKLLFLTLADNGIVTISCNFTIQ